MVLGMLGIPVEAILNSWNQILGFLMGIAKNLKSLILTACYSGVKDLEIPIGL